MNILPAPKLTSFRYRSVYSSSTFKNTIRTQWNLCSFICPYDITCIYCLRQKLRPNSQMSEQSRDKFLSNKVAAMSFFYLFIFTPFFFISYTQFRNFTLIVMLLLLLRLCLSFYFVFFLVLLGCSALQFSQFCCSFYCFGIWHKVLWYVNVLAKSVHQ